MTKSDERYGAFWVSGKNVLTHRWIYEQVAGFLSVDQIVMHSCDNPSCVTLQHLSAGSIGANNRDRHTKGRDAAGENGHSKLTDHDVDVIRARYATGDVTFEQLGDEFGVSGRHISMLVKFQSRRFKTRR